jgi:hypothetical protein
MELVLDDGLLRPSAGLGAALAAVVERHGPLVDLDEAVIEICASDPLAFTVPTEHETAWLDGSITALNGLTPRQAAADPTVGMTSCGCSARSPRTTTRA